MNYQGVAGSLKPSKNVVTSLMAWEQSDSFPWHKVEWIVQVSCCWPPTSVDSGCLLSTRSSLDAGSRGTESLLVLHVGSRGWAEIRGTGPLLAWTPLLPWLVRGDDGRWLVVLKLGCAGLGRPGFSRRIGQCLGRTDKYRENKSISQGF